MIKGVNKQVLEIMETDNSFFEKAIFFVKPEYSGMSEGKLRESAKLQVEKTGIPPKSKGEEKKSAKAIIVTASFFALGIFIGALVRGLI